MRRHLSHRESRTPPSCNSSPETPPSGPAHSCPSHPCCFCWCCCCSCSCLTQRDRDRAVCGRSRTASNVSPPGILQRLSVVEVSSWSHSFGRLLESTAGQSVFMEFLCSEHSQENMLFWLACQELKDQTRQAAITETAKQIYLDYISILSPNEVSIDAAVRDTINRQMAAPTAAIFAEAQVQIYALMHRDSYPRFLSSPLYQSLLQSPGPAAPSTDRQGAITGPALPSTDRQGAITGPALPSTDWQGAITGHALPSSDRQGAITWPAVLSTDR